MNEDMSENTSQEEQSSKMNPAVVGIIVLVIALVGFYALKTYGTKNESASTDEAMIETSTTPEAVMESADTTEAMSGDTAMTEEGVRVINVEGGGFYYSPNEIRVKKGETVKVVLDSVDMVHDFVIDELDVKTELAKAGETVTVEFTPDEVGEFEFYCSVGQHRANGMVGTLIVEE